MTTATRTLFHWSLRTDSRSLYPHVMRAAFAGIMLLAILAAWADAAAGMAPGLGFFRWICRLNVLLISVSGISYFASALTEEKDAGTLALLRLAGVSPLGILLSKSTSRLIAAFMLLLIQLPFTLLAITLGGVTLHQVLAAYLALTAWLCLVANAALLCSVRCSTSGRAAGTATGALLLFFSAPPLLQQIISLSPQPWLPAQLITMLTAVREQLIVMSVTQRLEQIFTGQTTGPAGTALTAPQFWHDTGLGVATFVLSILLFNRYSEPTESNPHGRSAVIRRYTVGRCWKLPLVWKDFLFFMGGKSFLLVKLLAYAALIGAFAWFHRIESPQSTVWLSDDLTHTAFGIVSILMTTEMLLYASNSLFQEVRQSAVAALKMLPISTPVLLFQKLLAVLLALLPAMIVLAALLLYNPSVFLNAPDFPEQIVAWMFITLVSTHLTVLLSLYLKWAALPVAVLLTMISFPCIAGAVIGLTGVTRTTAELNGIHWGAWLGVAVNFVWMWVFILIPIQIEIVQRWTRLSRQ